MRYILIFLSYLSVLVLLPFVVQAEGGIDEVQVIKSERKLMLLSKGEVVNEFKIALGGNPQGHKQQQGDRKTPEGTYILDYRNPNSAFYKSIHISYPNRQDSLSAKELGLDPGGLIMVHGQPNGMGAFATLTQNFDWTNGCIALSNADMDIFWTKVRNGTRILIKP